MIHLKDIISEINEEHTCYNCGQPVDINEAGFKFVIRNKKKVKKLICPPGTKSVGKKKCKRMSSTERQKRLKGLKITRRKAKAKIKKTLRKRAKSMKKRQSMGLKSDGIISLKDILLEGVMDTGILKAVFLAGGPGSGKGYVSKGLFGIPKTTSVSAYGLKVVNQDKELERMLKKYGFGTDLDDMPDEVFRQLTDPDYEDYSGLRGYAKDITLQQKKQYMNGRLGMIIDGTGHKYGSILKKKRELEEIGYDCYMVFVHTDLDVAQKRNMERPRKLSPELVETSWNDVQKNKISFQGLFGNNNFMMVDNSKTLGEKAAIKKFDMLMKKGINSFIKRPIKNYRGKKWIERQLILKGLK